MAEDFEIAASEFLAFIRNPEVAMQEEYYKLVTLLDRLALAITSYPDPLAPYEFEFEAPATITREILCRRFTQLGFYNTALPVAEEIGAAELGVGDAIDDLLDIAIELECALREENPLRVAVASFYVHWGAHLRQLQLCLSEQIKWDLLKT